MQQETLFNENVLYKEPALKKLLQAIYQDKKSIHATGLKGSFKSFLISLLKERLQNPFVVITPSIKEAEELWNDLQFFLKEDMSNGLKQQSKSLLFLPWDAFPFSTLSPSQENICQRLETLYLLSQGFSPVIITTPYALMQKVMPQQYLEQTIETLFAGLEIDRDRLIGKMIDGGYTQVSLVEEKGDYSVRGGILDLFPPLFKNPIRLEFFGDKIDSIRQFDLQSQRSLAALQQIVVLPVKEVIFNRRTIDNAIEKIRTKADENNLPRKTRDILLFDIKNSVCFPGIDFFLPFFYSKLNSLFDYLYANTLFLLSEQWEIEREGYKIEYEIDESYRLSHKKEGFYPEVWELYLPYDDVQSNLDRFQRVFLNRSDIDEAKDTQISFYTQGNEDIQRESLSVSSDKGVLYSFVKRILSWLEDSYRIILVCHTQHQARRLFDFLQDYELPVDIDLETSLYLDMPSANSNTHTMIPKLSIQAGSLLSGLCWPQAGIVLITEEEIFGRRKRRKPHIKPLEDYNISTFGELKTNDYVVHIDHGVGIYHGLEKLTIDKTENDYILIEYRNRDKLYLPVTRLNLLQKYMGGKDHSIVLDKLGGRSWEKKKKKVKESIKKMTQELLKLYATRSIQKGFAFSKRDIYYKEFEAAFQYEETLDQIDAIESVLKAMEDDKPMDKLICGDVGFGKTEVAIRASFKAVMDGKQIAVLVPTTILAQQHYQTFIERFDSYPVFIDVLSRFKSKKEQKTSLSKLRHGEIDIMIGTHRLLQKDVIFKDLGLLVIDEEHRFGVSQKEKLKKLKKTVDVIAMTATPIPRTLNMSLMQIRDLSIINTPPENRLAIKTYITKFDDNTIRRAILKETQRGGQVFFVHNRVESMPAMVRYLKKIVPEARMGFAHGQMQERDLEDIMMSFFKKEINLLVCTTIIESGLDFPCANTIIINRADKLGLAQMYQLRGRVGRGKQQAYSYLLVPGKYLVSKNAMKRLRALSELTELGSGFKLAAHDLEIRGAGNMLGTSQSGHIATVGYEMYMNLLEKTIKELKGEEITYEIEPEINLNVSAYIPQDYIKNTNQRLLAYKRLSLVHSDEDAEDIKEELKDRYGKIPLFVENLLELVKIKNLLKKFLITGIDYNGKEVVLSFDPKAEASVPRIVELITKEPKRFRFSPDLKFAIAFEGNDWKNIYKEVKELGFHEYS
ncbi:MAG: transcription-repair coupling factor [Thermodesulfobacteriota bacterium]|nr:transcription-repair coupling factor [Thermodesulfobacteriota bacterium]